MVVLVVQVLAVLVIKLVKVMNGVMGLVIRGQVEMVETMEEEQVVKVVVLNLVVMGQFV